MPEIISARALCSLVDVKELLGLTDIEHDNLLIRLVNSASEAIYAVADREFKVSGSNPQTRAFDVIDSCWKDSTGWMLQVGDLTSFTAVTIKNQEDATTVQTMLSAELDSLPRVRSSWEPVTRLRLRNAQVSHRYYIEVIGTWGFPAVPEDVRNAAVTTASIWFARDVQKFSETFSLQEDRVELPRSLPRQAFDAVAKYAVVNV